MQQFQVPQYINIEDRIIGPLTFKQFLYLVGGAAFIVVAWFFLQSLLFFLAAIPAAAFSLALAFLKINGRPFVTVLTNAVGFYLKPRLYIWKRAAKKTVPEAQKAGAPEAPAPKTPTLTESKLADLSWSLDIKEKLGR